MACLHLPLYIPHPRTQWVGERKAGERIQVNEQEMYGLQVFVCGSSLEPRRMRILAPRNSINPFGGLKNCSEDINMLLCGK